MTGNKPRLVALVTSNSYRDRQGETITTAALRDWVRRAWRGQGFRARSPLLFWHDDPPIGDVVYAEVHGPFLLELALERPTPFARAVLDYVEAAPPGTFGASHGFVYTASPAKGIYHAIDKFETSILPLEHAANPYTYAGVFPMHDEREQVLDRIPGARVALARLRGGAREAKARLDAEGVAHKDMLARLSEAQAEMAAALDALTEAVDALVADRDRLARVEKMLAQRPRAASHADETAVDDAEMTAQARKSLARRDPFWGAEVSSEQ
jgi:hypothetical protein